MATSAGPLLASTLFASSGDLKIAQSPSCSRRLSTNCDPIDLALESGLECGSVTCISGEPDSGGRELSQAFLISHLLSSISAHATLIDTGSFDVRGLHQKLSARLHDEVDAADKAMHALDRLKVMKAFDFVGLADCVAEQRDVLDNESSKRKESTPDVPPPRGTVGDNEDEGEDEMLDTITEQPRKPEASEAAKCGLLIIDSISQCVAPLMKNNFVQGQSLLASLMRSLAHLSRAHKLCIILVNGVTSGHKPNDDSPSIFSSCTVQPALGRAFAYTLDLHLLVHQVPRATLGERVSLNIGRPEAAASIVEVVHDRHGGRVGKWAAFTTDRDGQLNSIK